MAHSFARRTFLVLLAAQAGLVLWYQTDNAVYALGISIAISLAGGLLTIVKAYGAPETETASTWVLLFLSSAASILSIGKIDWVQMAYPLYVFALSGTILSGDPCRARLGQAGRPWRSKAPRTSQPRTSPHHRAPPRARSRCFRRCHPIRFQPHGQYRAA